MADQIKTFQSPEPLTPRDSTSVRNVAVLGATGSIGTATIDVLRHLDAIDPDHAWRLWAASGHRNLDCLAEQIGSVRLAPERIVLSDDTASGQKASGHKNSPNSVFAGPWRVLHGADALCEVASAAEVDYVVAAIVGRAGLESTLAAVDAGKCVALANKETLVVAGSLVRRKMLSSAAKLLPVDSEHSAIFQCICDCGAKPRRLILTASGGPFRTWTMDQMRDATPESALAHPTWDMGRKISIDSATMMNKALEIIEARYLFDIPADSIEVVVHRQSIIHSMVEFADNSVLAQMSPPDMRMPIQHALTYPRRLPGQSAAIDRSVPLELSLEPADTERFPALKLGFEVASVGGTAGVVVNAANEEAVGLFLERQIRFTDIVLACRAVLENHHYEPDPPLSRLLELDRWARVETRRWCGLEPAGQIS